MITSANATRTDNLVSNSRTSIAINTANINNSNRNNHNNNSYYNANRNTKFNNNNNNSSNESQMGQSGRDGLADFPHSIGNCPCKHPKSTQFLQKSVRFDVNENKTTRPSSLSEWSNDINRSMESTREDFLSCSYPNAVRSKSLQARARLTVFFDDDVFHHTDCREGK